MNMTTAPQTGPPGASRVYFMLCAERAAVKIGVSEFPERRRVELTQQLHVSMELLGHIPGTRKVERALHHHFQHLRIERELFRATPELLAAIDHALANPMHWYEQTRTRELALWATRGKPSRGRTRAALRPLPAEPAAAVLFHRIAALFRELADATEQLASLEWQAVAAPASSEPPRADYCRPVEAARRFGWHRNSVSRWAREGKVRAVGRGNSLRVHIADLETLARYRGKS